jgi:hypothetical protein
MHELPEGLVFHCGKCLVVIPADSPRPDGGDCEFVARHKLAWFNPKETIAGQHCMAVAAWSLIYHEALSVSVPHVEGVEYIRQFKRERKDHFAQSAARKAMTAEQVELASVHDRDWKLFSATLDHEKRRRLLAKNSI